MTYRVIPLFLFPAVLCANTPPISDGVPKRVREFSTIEARVKALPGVETHVAGTVTYGKRPYPIFAIRALGKGKKNVLLSGGVHGDEPAGTFALLEFLEKDAAKYAGEFRFHVFPCVNPSGFEADKLENAVGDNINRKFKKDGPHLHHRNSARLG